MLGIGEMFGVGSDIADLAQHRMPPPKTAIPARYFALFSLISSIFMLPYWGQAERAD